MAHNIESMAYNVQNGVPWHGLGVSLNGAMSVDDVMTAVPELGRKVHLVPTFAATPDGEVVQTPDFATWREGDNYTMASGFSKNFRVEQMVDRLAAIDALLGEGARYETAMTLNGGRTAVVLLRVDSIAHEVVPGDVVLPYLCVSLDYTGRRTDMVSYVSTRVVCANTESMARAEAISGTKGATGWFMRHNTQLSERHDDALRGFGRIVQASKVIASQSAKLAQVSLTEEVWNTALDMVAPVAADAKRTGRADGIRDALTELLDTQKGIEIPGVKGTLWAGLNAVTEYVDHHRSTRAVDGRTAADARTESLLFGSGSKIKADVRDMLIGFANTGRVLVAA